MKKFLFSCFALAALAMPASAEVVVTGKLSSTGDLVNFNSISGDTALATLNGQHTGSVSFRDLTGSTTFTAAANGNDIKIEGSQNLFIQVFDTAQNLVGTTTQVFSITGTADSQILAFAQSVDANGKDEGIQAFDLTALFGALKPGQNGYTFTAINGEVMTSLRILDVGGTITDFEHYRLDVAAIPVAAVPEASTWIMMIAGFLGIGGLAMRKRNGEGHAFRVA
jgi:hypothetical protein